MINNAVSIDMYMKEKYIFPNSYMKEAEIMSQDAESIFDIYWILLGDRYEILSICGSGSVLYVFVRNCVRKKKYVINLDVESIMEVPNVSYLTLYLKDNNSILCMEYNEKGIEFLRNHNKIRFMDCENAINESRKYFLGILAKNLVDSQMKADGIEFSQEYEVMYIGQSKKENIFERLNNHSTLQEIMRDTIRTTREKEIYIMTHSVAAKFYNKLMVDECNLDLVFGNTLERNFKVNHIVDNNAIIDIAEAMLISHFKPPYNEKLKTEKGAEKLSTYRKVGETNINPITFSLDLYWEECGEKMILYTDIMKTETKGRLLKCYFDEGKLEFSCEDIQDSFY